MALISRQIWLRRNRLVFEGVFTHPSNVFKEAVNSLTNFRRCNSEEGQQRTPRDEIVPAIPHARWMPPPSGFIKINWDASINQQRKCIGNGVIARDNVGSFLGSYCLTKQVDVDPLVAEVMAALEAVTFSREAGFFEGDALQVVKAIEY